METKRWSVDDSKPAKELIMEAAEYIKKGKLVAFPTETVYGLGANALDSAAVDRIFEAKGRPKNNPLIVHVRDIKMAKSLVEEWPESAQNLAEEFWPGPLTFVLKKGKKVPSNLCAGGETVAIRMPANKIAQMLIEFAKVPIAAPSANRSGKTSTTDSIHVLEQLNGKIDGVIEGGLTKCGIESTVIDLTSRPIRQLRPGPISLSQLELVLDESIEYQPVVIPSSIKSPMKSPGMLERHYQPDKPLRVFSTREEMLEYLKKLPDGYRYAILSREDVFKNQRLGGEPHLHILSDDPKQFSMLIYYHLQIIEKEDIQEIVMVLPPDQQKWHAVRDRLIRASSN